MNVFAGAMLADMSHDGPLPSWNGALYAANTAHHRIYDDAFLASLPLTPLSRVLDIGCGSGDFTRKVAEKIPDGFVVGLDAQPSMIAEAKAVARANQRFVLARAQELEGPMLRDEPFDVVFSRAALHWVPLADHAGILSGIRGRLRDGGWLRLEMGGAGNIPRTVQMLDAVSRDLGGPTLPWTFADAGTYCELLEAAGFDWEKGHVVNVAQRRRFDAESLRGWLESQVLQAYLALLPLELHAKFRQVVETRLGETRREDGSWDQTYVRLEVLARRR